MKQRMSLSLQQMQSDCSELRAQLQDRANSADRQAFDRSSLLAQVEALNSQLVSSAQSLDGVEADNRRLIQVTYTHTRTYICTYMYICAVIYLFTHRYIYLLMHIIYIIYIYTLLPNCCMHVCVPPIH